MPDQYPSGAKFTIAEIRADDKQALRVLAKLHVDHLAFGAMSGLGEGFVRRIGYALPIQMGLMHVAAGFIDGRLAGFVAYARDGAAFRDKVFARRVILAGAVMRALLTDPRRVVALWHAMQVANTFPDAGADDGSIGEITAVVVPPEFTSAAFVRESGIRMSEALITYALNGLSIHGAREIRAFVDAFNRPMLMLYGRLGASLTPIKHAGRDMVEVRFVPGEQKQT